MIIMGVADNMIQVRDLPDITKVARTMAITGTRVITTMETRTSSHLTSSHNLFTRISNHGNNNKELVSSFKGIRVGVTVDTVGVATMGRVPEAVATGVSAYLIISMGRATGKLNVPHSLCARSAVAHT